MSMLFFPSLVEVLQVLDRVRLVASAGHPTKLQLKRPKFGVE